MTNLKRIGIILTNVIISYVITLILYMVYALVLEYTNVPESTIPILTTVIGMISVFIGSSLAVMKIKEKGLINGAIVGLIYILFVYLLSSILSTGFGLNGYSLSIIAFYIIFGMIGGIIGVNIRKEGR